MILGTIKTMSTITGTTMGKITEMTMDRVAATGTMEKKERKASMKAPILTRIDTVAAKGPAFSPGSPP